MEICLTALLTSPDIRRVEEAYQAIFGTASIPDDEHTLDVRADNINTQIYKPIILEKVRSLLGKKHWSSIRLDHCTIAHLKNLPISHLTILFNLILYTSHISSSWKQSRTVFIPKKDADPQLVDSWRPITISSIALCLFNKILASRFRDSVSLCEEKRGFTSNDLANTFTLQSLIKHLRQSFWLYSISTLDLRKAFNTVLHWSIFQALQRFSINPKIAALVRDSYTGASTRITVDGSQTASIALLKGVKQGDPLSPVLFNMVIDKLIVSLQN